MKNAFLTPFLIISLVFPASSVPQENQWSKQASKLIQQVGGQIIKSKKSKSPHYRRQKQASAQVSKYFPKSQCIVGPARTSYPENVCQSSNPARSGEAIKFKNLAIQNIVFFESLLVKAQKSKRPKGIQCLEEASEKELGKIQDVINRLKIESDNIKRNLQSFRDEQQANLDKMKELHGDLHGREEGAEKGGKSLASKFSPVCQDILSTEVLSKANSVGLFGLKSNPDFIAKSSSANKAKKNIETWKRELRSKIKKIRDEVKQYGPTIISEKGALSSMDITNSDLNKSILTVAVRESTSFQREYNRTKSYLKKELSYGLPDLDENFNSNINDFVKKSTETLKKKFVHECATQGRYNISAPPDKILQGLKQKDASRSGSNVINYRRRLKSIMESDSFIEDKMAAINALDRQYRNLVTINYHSTGTRKITQTPGRLYAGIIQSCRKKVEQKVLTKNAASSDADKIHKAVDYLNKLKKKSDTFHRNIGNAIYERVANCDGRNLKAGMCTTETMNSESAGFCIRHAETCAKSIQGCRGEIDVEIQKKSNHIKEVASKWNKAMEVMVQNQERYLKTNLLPGVLQSMQLIKNYLPGVTWEYSPESFIRLPPMKKSPYGVSMRGGGKLDTLEQLPQLIEENLVKMLENQKEKLAQEYQKHIEEVDGNIRDNIDIWKKVKRQCEKMEGKILAANQKENQRKIQNFQKTQKFL